MNSEELLEHVRPAAATLVEAVDLCDRDTIARTLHGLTRQELYAAVVLLAANADLPLVDRSRLPTDVDEIRVRRILDGDHSLCAEVTTAERRAVITHLRNRGWTRVEIARACGWSPGTVGKDFERTKAEVA